MDCKVFLHKILNSGGSKGALGTPPWDPISFIFMQFSAHILPNNRLVPPSPLGKSWLCHCMKHKIYTWYLRRIDSFYCHEVVFAILTVFTQQYYLLKWVWGDLIIFLLGIFLITLWQAVILESFTDTEWLLVFQIRIPNFLIISNE